MNGYHPTMANYISNNPLVSNLESKIRSLYKLGRLQESLKQIIHSEIPFESSSLYIPILQLCINTKSEKEGRLLHNHLKTNNSPSNRYLNTKWIIFYAKIGDIETARKVFDEMPERNVVSWTAMISGYCQNGYCRKGLEVFREMRKGGVEANGFTYGSVLKGCTSMMGLEMGRVVHGCVVKSRFSGDLFVQSALVDLYSKCGRMEDGRCVFEMMEERDVVCWNAVIGGYAVQGYSEDSFSMFRLMLREGLMPDQFSFGSVLKASGYGRLLVPVLNIHGLVVRLGFQFHIVVTGSLIDAYAKCGNVRSARVLYDLMKQKDLISCTALITGYANEGRNSKDALEVFSELYQMNMGMDNVVLCSMLNICANIASLSLGSQIHALALKGQHEFDVAMGNALIDMYAKSGEIEDAYRTFNEMKVKNVVSWTSLIAGFGKHGYGEKAIALFDEMEDNGLKPNDVTFLSVLFACSHTGMTDEGWKCFMSMINGYSITPRPEHYSCMIDLLARAGQLEQAFNLLCEKKCKPSASLWSAILGAAKTYRLLSVGKEAAMHLFELEPENAANYILLASIYSEAGLWEEAAKVRKLMQQRNTKKDPACSLVQCNVKPVL